MVAIVDYDAGNTKSVQKAFAHLGANAVLTREPAEILRAKQVVLPGVGAFGDAMGKLQSFGLVEVLKEAAASGKPFLGICLGLQLLFERSEESPGVSGLGIFRGESRHFTEKEGYKIPQIGWNSLKLAGDGRLFQGLSDGTFVYFVHSYYVHAEDRSIVKAVCQYTDAADASIESGNVFACQFHPEKSGAAGLRMLENFLSV
ncbi:MAG: imidazole glycerol phosphate synthase subunit HisH [Lachnospiraceae bacterium]